MEERVGEATAADRQNIWGQRYVDDLVLRDRDTDANGTLDERLYAMQDPNWNVVAVSNTSGAIQERYSYTAYGRPSFLDSAFASRASSSYSWATLYTGREYDSETGLYHYRMRSFGAELGRFVTQDPIGYEGGINFYEYASDSPGNQTDPSGLRGATPESLCDAFPDKDDSKKDDKCPDKNNNKKKCTKQECLRLLKDVQDAISKTAPCGWFGCYDWVTNFNGNYGRNHQNPCAGATDGIKQLKWFVSYGKHWAYKITLPNGTVWWVDNGAIGGSGHIGTQLPSWIWE